MSAAAASINGKGADASTVPKQAKIVLLSLILVAAVANLNLSVANVALPDIGKSFDASQTMLDLIAVGYSLGLAASVLWFGALVYRFFPKKEREEALRASYHAVDSGAVPTADERRPPRHVPVPGWGPALVPDHVPVPGEAPASVPGHVPRPDEEA